MDVRAITKYLPRRFRRRIRKKVARRKIHGGMVETLYSQRDLAIKDAEKRKGEVEELEGKVQELGKEIASHEDIVERLETERVKNKGLQKQVEYEKQERVRAEENYKKINDAKNGFIEAARKVKRSKPYYLAVILTGNIHHLGDKDFGKLGINEALVQVARDERVERESLVARYETLQKDSLACLVEAVCIDHDSKRLPIFVYHAGEMIYSSPKFDKMTYTARYVVSELESNPKIKKRIEAGKKAKMEYCNGKLFFVPEKLRNGEVISIVHYVPAGKNRASRIYAKRGGEAVKEIYKTLKSLDKAGLEFVKNENQ